MKFFSGFCLQNEKELFSDCLQDNDFTVAGFSMGAIDALEYTLRATERIDRLILLSPAYFCDKDAKFKKTQLLFFKKNPQNYIQNFLQNAAYPSDADVNAYAKEGSRDQLQKLLEYDWSALKQLDTNICLEVHLGAKDRIIDAYSAHDFFKHYAQSFLYKPYGHLLR